MKKIILWLLILLQVPFILGCNNQPRKLPRSAYVPAFRDEVTINGMVVHKGISHLRLRAIKDTAFGVGAQAGLAWRAQQIDQILQNQVASLDQVFNFRGLILSHNIQPPVLAEAQNTLHVNDPNTIRLADQTYRILRPARFITAPLTWREYLWLDYKKPENPDGSLLPRTKEEREVWNEYVIRGWRLGIDQANEIFAANLGRLQRDVKGMVLYRKLLAQNMVSPPFVAKADLGITGGGREMRINDQVLRITAQSELNPDSKIWRPAVYKNPNGPIPPTTESQSFWIDP
jgi:defect-in-organelle-trafficking protein DotC